MKIVSAVLVALIALASAQLPEKKPVKRSYVCPPNFIRLSHRCYFFSKEPATWQDAYFQCRDLHSNLAVIRNSNQDKLIRRFLSKKTLEPLERWLGGLYDWEQMAWKWGSSGRRLTYQGFSRMEVEDKEKLRWHCIIMDPNLQFKWNTRSCLEQKQFICHTKIKIVTNKGKKKLQRQYNVDKYNKLNEIPVPVLPDDVNYNISRLKEHQPNGATINSSAFALKSKEKKRRARRNKKKSRKTTNPDYNSYNTTYIGFPEVKQADRWRRQKEKDERMSMEHFKWKTYFKDATLSPLHPKPIVEEFNYVKEP